MREPALPGSTPPRGPQNLSPAGTPGKVLPAPLATQTQPRARPPTPNPHPPSRGHPQGDGAGGWVYGCPGKTRAFYFSCHFPQNISTPHSEEEELWCGGHSYPPGQPWVQSCLPFPPPAQPGCEALAREPSPLGSPQYVPWTKVPRDRAEGAAFPLSHPTHSPGGPVGRSLHLLHTPSLPMQAPSPPCRPIPHADPLLSMQTLPHAACRPLPSHADPSSSLL